MKLYYLQRDIDVTGASGTGLVAEVVEFGNGKAVVSWNGGTNQLGVSSTVVYDSIEDVIRVHGHNGYTRLIPIGELLREGEL